MNQKEYLTLEGISFGFMMLGAGFLSATIGFLVGDARPILDLTVSSIIIVVSAFVMIFTFVKFNDDRNKNE